MGIWMAYCVFYFYRACVYIFQVRRTSEHQSWVDNTQGHSTTSIFFCCCQRPRPVQIDYNISSGLLFSLRKFYRTDTLFPLLEGWFFDLFPAITLMHTIVWWRHKPFFLLLPFLFQPYLKGDTSPLNLGFLRQLHIFLGNLVRFPAVRAAVWPRSCVPHI